ncbi:hypothetical protein PVK06_006895 [Gossypium arboreum]|uniref:HAT C-terminal dimerisation domain-containing protein n=1 Tax=Gossypium arboreum TaxID=29729 RepID=A0ABR0QG15_GOSAR|nr:hypothetical protein PVK06_006895 [Gossypium arboreum]
MASTSSKHHDELQKAQANEIACMVSINELKTGICMNQIGTSQCPDVPDTNARNIVGHSHSKKEDVMVEHHHRVDIYFAMIDTQLLELNNRFNETVALDPKEFFKFFGIEKICALVNKFYSADFSQQEKERLSYELKHYELDACPYTELRKILTLFDLCKKLVESEKSISYPLVDKLIHLILTLSVSIAFIEHVFSAMKTVKTKLCTKMEDDVLKNSLVV